MCVCCCCLWMAWLLVKEREFQPLSIPLSVRLSTLTKNSVDLNAHTHTRVELCVKLRCCRVCVSKTAAVVIQILCTKNGGGGGSRS